MQPVQPALPEAAKQLVAIIGQLQDRLNDPRLEKALETATYVADCLSMEAQPEWMQVVADARMTPMEAAVFGQLWRAKGKPVHQRTIHHAIYGMRADGGPDLKIIDVLVCKLRPKLKGTKWRIDNHCGHGYALRP